MTRFLRRHAIFFLFPAVVVAILFLARINFSTAMRFGEWGEKSIVESTLILAKEKVERVERTISTMDHGFFQMLDPAQIDMACERWNTGIKHSRLVEAAVILDEEGEIIEYFSRDSDARAARLYELVTEEVIPLMDMYESLYQHKHLHRLLEGKYRLVTSLTRDFEGQFYTTCLIYDTHEIVDRLFEDLIGDVGRDRIINVVDYDGRIIFGSNLSGAGEFIVVQRFPSTLYKWRVQLAPRSAALFSNKARTQKVSGWLLIPLAFGVIVFGLVVLYMAIVRERRLGRLKSEFIANTSHELKTPLALIRMFSELLATDRVTEAGKVRRYHEIILRETERLTALIDNVLDFSKIERGKSAYEFKEMDLTEVVRPAIEIYRHRIDESDVEMVFTAQEDLPRVRIDADAIALALINLIDNALKYAVGTDVIGVEIHRDSKNVYLEVFDKGAGIPAHHLKRVFERFYRFQATDLHSNGQRGSGIGLSLVEHIAKAHGGSVTVTSTPGVETRFSIRIPSVV